MVSLASSIARKLDDLPDDLLEVVDLPQGVVFEG
jgi:hypothetical protein